MSDNPFFYPDKSSDEIFFGQDMTVCLTDVVNEKADVDHSHGGYATTSDLAGKANTNHTHSEYADVSHTHSEYATVTALAGKANGDHSHSEYAEVDHNHSEYATVTALNGKADVAHTHADKADVDHTHDDYATVTALNGKADVNHSHSDYASVTHDHDEVYAAIGHTHADKADVNHTHNYAAVNHTHDNYAATTHNHTGVYDPAGTAQNKADAALEAAKAYTDGVKNDLLNGAGAAYDTLQELGDLIDDNQDAIDALETVAAGKADSNHIHSEYAPVSHTHNYAPTTHIHSEYATVTALNDKADADHTHNYAAVNHTHADKADVGHTHDNYATVTALNGKADADHTHNYAASNHTHADKANVNHTHDDYASVSHTHADKADATHTHSNYATVTALNGKADADHTHSEYAATSHTHDIYATVAALAGKADANHAHSEYALANATTITVAGEDLNDYETAGIYVFAQAYTPANIPAGTNGWLIVIPWNEGSQTVKQFWLRHGTVDSNDFEVYSRTKVGAYNTWGTWSKFYTTSNPPTAAEVGAQELFTSVTGGVEYSYSTGNTVDLLEEISNMPPGMHTVYSLAGTKNNPKTTESWRLLIHKTNANIAWVVAFGSNGTIYANYQYDVNAFRGWRCVYETTNSCILWKGASYLTSTDGTPQVVTPSKKLSECRTGWLLLWSDYDASTNKANDSDFCTTYIPKYNPSGGTWGGKAFLCTLPTYVGGDAADLSTQVTVLKPIYVHDDCIKGSYQNTTGGRNDVVLRAVYEV